MVRPLTAVALLAALAGVALAVAASRDPGRAERPVARAHRPARALAPPVSPRLRTVADLAAPGGPGQVDSGVGVYPVLASPARLAFPGPASVRRAERYARARLGEVAFAVADDRGGVRGMHAGRPFSSASLSKAMLLVAYLRQLANGGRPLSKADGLTLDYMIRFSDNASADIVYSRVGDAALGDVARRAGMTSFDVSGYWAGATVTAADQAPSS